MDGNPQFMSNGKVDMRIGEGHQRKGELFNVIIGVLRIMFQNGVVLVCAALLEHLVEIVDGAGLIVGLPVHDLFGGGEQHSALVVEGKVGTESLL